jgi:glycosyltransferase involved in cell wall biosynthesis
MTAPYAINGRFLTHTITGVQRYARNVIAAIDASDHGGLCEIIAPKASEECEYLRLRLVARGHLKGHVWEQIELPMIAGARRLLNLCNTAPASKSDQIACIHDANVFSAAGSYSVAFRTLYRNLLPVLARRSARIATVSHAAARQLSRHLPVKLSDIAILPNGHEHALSWNPSRAIAAPALRSPMAGRPYVLALGSKALHKNIALVMDIAPELDRLGVDIIVAGGGEGIFTQQSLTGGSNVELCGRVSDDDLAYLLDHALCLVFPSITEGFGLPILEAMARGCPVISSDSASMPEVCGDAALLASPFEPARWITHIGSVLQSANLRDDLIGRGAENVRRFSWKQTAEGYMDLLASPSHALSTHTSTKRPSARIAAVFATRGRPEIAEATVRHFLRTQTQPPDCVIVSCVDASDAGQLASMPSIRVVTGPSGLAAQRNTALMSLPPATEIVAFFDDDFVADRRWLSAAAAVFRDESQVVGFTGHVVRDGIKGPGISFEEAIDIVSSADTPQNLWSEPYSPYGCNMAFRVTAIGDLRFDERLVLYGWLEDRDFAAALARQGGRLIKCSQAFGVHMGVKSGRMSGQRLGYSQVINPIYMMGKGTMSLIGGTKQISKNIASNVGRLFWPEPFIDRRGRVKGNLLAFADIARGRLEPERAANICTQTPSRKPGHWQETR